MGSQVRVPFQQYMSHLWRQSPQGHRTNIVPIWFTKSHRDVYVCVGSLYSASCRNVTFITWSLQCWHISLLEQSSCCSCWRWRHTGVDDGRYLPGCRLCRRRHRRRLRWWPAARPRRQQNQRPQRGIISSRHSSTLLKLVCPPCCWTTH